MPSKSQKRKQPTKSQDDAEAKAKAKAARLEKEAKEHALVAALNAAIEGGGPLPTPMEEAEEPPPAASTSTGAPPALETETGVDTTGGPAQAESGAALDVSMTDVTETAESPAQAVPEPETAESPARPAQAVADGASVASAAAGPSKPAAASLSASPVLKADKSLEKKRLELETKLEEDIASVKETLAKNPEYSKTAQNSIDKLIQKYKDVVQKLEKDHAEAKEKAAQQRLAQGAWEFFSNMVSGCVDGADLKANLTSFADDVMRCAGDTSEAKFFTCVRTNVAEINKTKDDRKEAEAQRHRLEKEALRKAKADEKAGTPKNPSVSDEELQRIKQAREALKQKTSVHKRQGKKEHGFLSGDVLKSTEIKSHILAVMSGDPYANIQKKAQRSTGTHGGFVEGVWNKLAQEFEAKINQRDLAINNAKIADSATADFFSPGMIDCEETRAMGVPSLESCLSDALASCGYAMIPLKLANLIQAKREHKAEKERKAAEKKADKASVADPPDGVVVAPPVVILSDDEGDKERETAEPHTAEVSAQAAPANGKAPMAPVAMETEPIDEMPM